MPKVVYNACHGGFGLSHEAVLRYAEIKGLKLWPEKQTEFASLVPWRYFTAPPEGRANDWAANFSDRDISRTDPALIQVVEEMGEAASDRFASLAIAEVQEGQRYRIDEYDGAESVMTVDDYDWKVA